MKSKVILNHKYSSLLTSDCRYGLITGGRGSGKSYSIAVLLVLLSFEPDHIIIFARQTAKSLVNSGITELQEKITDMGLDDYFRVVANEIENKQSGSKIRFIGLKSGGGTQTSNTKSLTGATTLVIEEAEECVEKDFNKIDLSIRSKLRQNRIFLVMNPTTKAHWVYNRFFQSKGVNPGHNGVVGDVNYVHTTYLDNKENLSESFVKQLETLKLTDPASYNLDVMGGWLTKLSGTIYNNWSMGEFPTDVDVIFGSDFGFSRDPDTLVGIHINRRQRKIYLKEHLYQNGLTTPQLAEIYQNTCGNRLIIADSAEPRLIAEIKGHGLKIRACTKGAGSILEGIKILKDYELIVDPSSKNLMTELNNYVWLDRGNIARDDFNHILDAVRYACTHYLKGGMSGKHSVY